MDWLNEKRLIQSIIELLDPSHDRDTHDNASRLLIEVSRLHSTLLRYLLILMLSSSCKTYHNDKHNLT